MQRAILEVKRRGKSYSKAVEAFVEEAVVRRELSDNFCFYNPKYDTIEGAYGWAQETLRVHRYALLFMSKLKISVSPPLLYGSYNLMTIS